MSNHMPAAAGPTDTAHSPYARLATLDRNHVSLRPGFWSERQAVNRGASLRHGFEMLEKSGNLHNLRLAAGLAEGQYRGRNFLDSDVYKWLEAVAWELGKRPDAALQSMADQAITLIAAAQRPDGYINSYYQTVEPEARWADLDHSHELYCAGHLFQAAVAYQRSVGDGRLLAVACRFADHICDTFGAGRREGTSGHPEVEMALVELYRVTGRPRYLEQAELFIDRRGRRQMRGLGPYGPEYHQDHVPVRQVTEAAGHTVRQLYLAAGVTDLYLETGEQALLDAMGRLWDDIAGTKLYITGGLGARFDGEAFGDPYELPGDQCYCEACSSIASFMWNWRLLLATGEARFADQMERALYNTILASPSLDGLGFFYVNPLLLREAQDLRLSSNPPPSEGFVPIERPAWHDVACCPPNVMRLLASLESYLATRSPAGIQVHHYAAADIASELAQGGRAGLRVATEYPWHGQVRLEVTEASAGSWELALRLPAWSAGARLAVNGQEIDEPAVRGGYLVVKRSWQVGDVVDLDLGMEPMLVAPNPRIDATRGCLAIQRGPLVYCLEDRDQELPGRLLDVEIEPRGPLTTRWQPDLLGGVMVVESAGRYRDLTSWQGNLYAPVSALPQPAFHPARLVAVPYYTWGNRGIGAMRVWIPQTAA